MPKIEQLTIQEQKALTHFKRDVAKICGPSGWEIKVFGSRARQEGDEESDIDLLVLLKDYSENKKIQIWDAAYYIFSATDILISPLVLSYEQFQRLQKRERLIAKDIERDGFIL